MRRIGRWMLSVATVLSLLLCVAVVVLWVRSYWKADGVERARGRETTAAVGPAVRWRTTQFISNRRGIAIASFWGLDAGAAYEWGLTDDRPHWFWSNNVWVVDPPHALRLRKIGLFAGYYRDAFSGALASSERHGLAIGAPHWLVALLFAVVPVVRLIRRWRRPGVGFCVVCHYDLTGNVSGVCPECGTAIANLKSQSANLK